MDNHGQTSLGQSERNFNSMRFTNSVAKSSAVFLQIHAPSPSPPNTMLKAQRNRALTVSALSVGWGEGEGRTVLVARGYNFAWVKKRSNCTTVPRLLSMIVDN